MPTDAIELETVKIVTINGSKVLLNDAVAKLFQLEEDLRPVSVINSVRAGNFSTVDDDDILVTVRSAIKDDSAFALVVKGDSMDPVFHDGDLIVVSPSRNVNNGDYVVILDLEENQATVKTFHKQENKITLTPENQDYPIITITKNQSDRYKIAGRVCEVHQYKRKLL